MILSVIIPAYNEELVLKQTLDNYVSTLNNYLSPHTWELLVIDDFSTDSTKAVASSYDSQYIQVHTNIFEKGISGAIKTGMDLASGDYLTIVTADGADPAENCIDFLNTAQKKNLDFVFGDRFVLGRATGYPFIKRFLNRLGNQFLGWLFNIYPADMTCSFKLIKKTYLKKILPLKTKGFVISLEIAIRLLEQGGAFDIRPHDWRERSAGQSKMKILKTSLSYAYFLIQFYVYPRVPVRRAK